MVKMPFTTNMQAFWSCRNIAKVISNVTHGREVYGDIISYCLVQPRLENRREIKVCINDMLIHTVYNIYNIGWVLRCLQVVIIIGDHSHIAASSKKRYGKRLLKIQI